MRLVAMADTHTFEADLEVPAGDVLVHAGDLLRRGSLEELEAVAEWLRSLPHRHKVVIPGNHERCFESDEDAARALLGDSIHTLIGCEVTLDGVRFWGGPWQPEFNGWAFNLPRGEPLAKVWAGIPTNVDVLITHGPPLGFGDRSWDERAGCADLLDAVRRTRPALHLFGHIHQDGGLWRDSDVVLANVTTWECERAPTVIDYDPATRQVTPIMVPPARFGTTETPSPS